MPQFPFDFKFMVSRIIADSRNPRNSWKLQFSAGFAHHCYHDAPVSRSDVAFEMEYLLPGAERKLSARDWDCQLRPHQRGLQMRVAVAVAPGLFMPVARLALSPPFPSSP